MSPALVIRRFRPMDAKAASRLMRRNLRQILAKCYPKKTIRGWEKEFTPSWLVKLAKGSSLFVAIDKGKISGVASLNYHKTLQDRSKRWWIRIMFVEPARHGMGIGHKLMEKIVKKAEKQKAASLFANSSLGAVEFYQKMGFKKMKKSKVKNGGYVWRMRKQIKR